MRMRESMKRTGLYTVIAFLMATAVCWSLPLVASPLSGRACDMAVVPDTNVNLATHVRDVLNAAGGNVTNDCLTFFQGRANLNKWSKYKPVINQSIVRIDDSAFKNANYGIWDTPYWIRLASMKTGFIDKTTLPENMQAWPSEYWRYFSLEGNYVKRCSDFINYSTGAVSPITVVTGNEITYKSDKVATIIFGMGAIDNLTLKISDLGIMGSGGSVTHWFSNMYLGICLFNGSVTYFMTQTTKTTELPSLGNHFRIPNADTLQGTYTVFAFISNRAITSLQTADSVVGIYAPIPGTTSQITIKPYTYNFVIIVDYAYRKDTRTVEYRYMITNNETSAYTTEGITIELVNSLNTVLATTSNVYTTIQANSSYTNTATIVTTIADVRNAALLRVRTKIAGQDLVGEVSVTDDRPPIIG